MKKPERDSKYPGSGGATKRPLSGGTGWHPLPDDTWIQVPVIETVLVGATYGRSNKAHKRRKQAALKQVALSIAAGRVVPRERQPTLRAKTTIVGYTLRKNYR
jgi:hypothetical protein